MEIITSEHVQEVHSIARRANKAVIDWKGYIYYYDVVCRYLLVLWMKVSLTLWELIMKKISFEKDISKRYIRWCTLDCE